MENRLIAEFHCPNTQCARLRTVGEKTTLLIHETAKSLVKQGKIPDNEYYLSKRIVNLISPQAAVLTIPCLIITSDICASCGTEHTVMVEYAEMPVTGNTNPKKN